MNTVNQRSRPYLSAPPLRSVKDTLADVRGEDRRRSGWRWVGGVEGLGGGVVWWALASFRISPRDNSVTAAAFGCGVSSVFLPPPLSSDLTQADRCSSGSGHHSKSCS